MIHSKFYLGMIRAYLIVIEHRLMFRSPAETLRCPRSVSPGGSSGGVAHLFWRITGFQGSHYFLRCLNHSTSCCVITPELSIRGTLC